VQIQSPTPEIETIKPVDVDDSEEEEEITPWGFGSVKRARMEISDKNGSTIDTEFGNYLNLIDNSKVNNVANFWVKHDVVCCQ
jgi:hypothetical protein